MIPSKPGKLSNILPYINSDCYDRIFLDYESSRKKDMSIVVSLIGMDGIVLATDSQRNKGNYSTISEKLFALTPNIGLMTLGYNAEFRRFVIESWLEANQNINCSYSDICFNFALNFKNKIEPYFTKEFRLQLYLSKDSLDFIIGGYDTNKQSRIFSISSSGNMPFSPLECEPCYIDGIKEVGIYWSKKTKVDELIAKQKLSCEFLKRFAVMVILETIKFSELMVCEPIQLAVIDKETNQFRDVSSEVDKIKGDLDPKQKWLYNYLDTLAI
jgi:20S proteasome alpha/beta subunit